MPEQDPQSGPEGEGSPDPVPMAQVWQPPEVAPTPIRLLPPPPPAPSYASYGQYGGWAPSTPFRPGTVTALGVTSIVVASLTFIGCGIGAFAGLQQFGMAQMSRTMATSMARQASIQPPAPAGLPARQRGLTAPERDVAISVFSARQPMTSARQAQLDALLAEAGQTILGAEAGSVTSGATRTAIRTSSVGRSPRESESGPCLFTTATGSIEIYDDRAIFRPDDHSDIVRTSADVNAYLVAHDDPSAAAPPVRAYSSTVTATPAAVSPAGRASGSALAMVVLEAGLSLAVAIYLLVTGILTLRGTRAGAVLHWVYVPIKALLIALAVYAWSQLSATVASIIAKTPPNPWSGRAGSGDLLPMTMSVLAGGYVVMIVVLLLLPTTRDFYRKQA